jgi:hypothetical protein
VAVKDEKIIIVIYDVSELNERTEDEIVELASANKTYTHMVVR